MTVLENYHRNAGDQLPAFFVNQIQEMLSGLSPAIRLTQPTNTAIRLAGSTGNVGRQGATVNGLWRYVDVDTDATHPGGAAGVYNIFIVCSANAIDGSYNDTTDYAFYPEILPVGTNPTGNTPAAKPIAAYRLIGQCEWDGTKITGFWQFVGTNDTTMPLKPTAPGINGWAVKATGVAGQVVPIHIVQDSTGAVLHSVGPGGTAIASPLTIDGKPPPRLEPVVTAIPTVDPVTGSGAIKDGQGIFFVADATNGVVWHLKYRAASSSTFKWEYVGGSALLSQDLPGNAGLNVPLASAVSTTSYYDAYSGATPTPGPAPLLTLPALPNGGDFYIEYGSGLDQSVTAAYSINGATVLRAAGDAIAITSSGGASVSTIKRITGIAGGSTFKMVYYNNGSAAGDTWERYIKLTPIRVS